MPFAFQAQNDLNVKSGIFDYVAYGRTYEYNGEYVISKETGSNVKLPHGKGRLKQPEKFEKAMVDVDIATIERYIKKGYNPEPYLYDGEWNMGKKNGIAKELIFSYSQEGMQITTPKLSEYEGSFKDDVFGGNGSLKLKEFEYIGAFKNGKLEGVGKMTHKNKDTYEGEFLANEYNGKGTFIYFDSKNSYQGEFVANKYHGKGTFSYFESKESFKGIFENNVFKKGFYTYKTGNTYDGEWKDGLPSGTGTYNWKSSGDLYVGDFIAGNPKGQGKLTQKDGTYFEGLFTNGNCTGKAKIYFRSIFYDEDSKAIDTYGLYEGDISSNKPNGNGKFTASKCIEYTETDTNGIEKKSQLPEFSYTGAWQNGQKAGEGTLVSIASSEYYISITTYTGAFQNDMYEAEKATLNISYNYDFLFYNYVGGFKSGKYHGSGKLVSSGEGESYVYEGQFLNHQFHGLGVQQIENGLGNKTFKGTFQNGYITQGTEELFEETDKLVYLYKGSFKGGSREGNGKIDYLRNLDEVTQDWSENKVKSYEGAWVHDLPNGQGNILYTNGTKVTGSFRDGDYLKPFSAPSVKIDSQTWMTENLSVVTFRNGDPILVAKSINEWVNAGNNKTPALCYINNDPNTVNKGILYNWYAVNDSRGLAPEGWHIPSHIEVEKFRGFLMSDIIIKQQKITDQNNNGINTNNLRTELDNIFRTCRHCLNCENKTLPSYEKGAKYFIRKTDRYYRNESGNFINDHYEYLKGFPQGFSRFWTSSIIGDEGYKLFFNERGFLNCGDNCVPSYGSYTHSWLVYKSPGSNKIEGLYVRCIKD